MKYQLPNLEIMFFDDWRNHIVGYAQRVERIRRAYRQAILEGSNKA